MDKTESLIILSLIIFVTLITLLYVFILFRKIKRYKIKNKEVETISGYIKEGAMAFLLREYKVMIPFILVVAVLLTVLGFIPNLKDAEGIGYQAAICFIVGALFSAFAGFVGMMAATKSNSITVESARDEGMPKALHSAFSGGAVLGLTVSALGLLGLVGLFTIFYTIFNLKTAVHVVSGYSLGCSMIALFGRVGGGIYTKAADVGADLVGKVEAGIPEDDPRNPAVIADNVGDNVGDIAGMGSDLTESYVGSIISSLSIGVLGVTISGQTFAILESVMFPLILAGLGVLSALMSVIFIRMKKWKNPSKTLRIATYVAAGIILVAALILSLVLMNNIRPFLSVLCGVVSGLLLGFIAEIYTSSDYKEVKEIAKQSETGHATNIIAGFGSGMKSTALTVLVLAAGIIIAYVCFDSYGIALAAVGMLSTAGITISVDAYGPISDNAGGIAEMSKMDKHVREITDHLDSVGNTTAAIGKGFCIGSAALTSLALFVAYSLAAGLNGINIINPTVIIGLLIGAMLPYLFSSITIKSVGKAANKMIEEVRTQFRNDPGIMEGKSKPNYSRCVDISTKAALKEMILPGIIAIGSPIATGFILGAEGLGGLLAGGLASSVMLAVFMANSGGAWDNAKKYIEQLGLKGTETHKSAVTGDTVGDPFKDTSGPAMDILIKLMSIISLILAPVLTQVESLIDIIIKAING